MCTELLSARALRFGPGSLACNRKVSLQALFPSLCILAELTAGSVLQLTRMELWELDRQPIYSAHLHIVKMAGRQRIAFRTRMNLDSERKNMFEKAFILG